MKKVLSIILTAALLCACVQVPALAGSLAAYLSDGPQFANQDGWNLVSFEANGPNRYSALGWANLPTIVSLKTVWERNGETVVHETGDQVLIAPGTFTWTIEDESVAQLVPAQVLPPEADLPSDYYTDGTHALLLCLREGKTVVTVTGPHGAVSKCGLVVMPEATSGPTPSDSGYTNDEIFTTDDDWTISFFSLDLNGEALNQEMGVGNTGTLQIHSSWYRDTDALVPETVSGYMNFAPEAFAWSVSDESVAVLRDDYPGTTARSLVALSEGYVTVTVTGPLGKWFTRPIFVLPIDEFDGGKPGDDTGKPPTFDKPKPWRIDVGGIVGGFLVDWLFKPFLRPFLSDDGGEWLDELGDRLKGWINKALRPVQWAVDTALDVAEAVMRAAAEAPPLSNPLYIMNYLYAYMLSVMYDIMAPLYYSIPFLESFTRGILERSGWKVPRIIPYKLYTGTSSGLLSTAQGYVDTAAIAFKREFNVKLYRQGAGQTTADFNVPSACPTGNAICNTTSNTIPGGCGIAELCEINHHKSGLMLARKKTSTGRVFRFVNFAICD